MRPRIPSYALLPALGLAFFSMPAQAAAFGDPAATVQGQRAWADFDGDGRVDLYRITPGESDLLLWNDGKNAFVDITDSTGLQGLQSRSVQALDYDGDARTDLLLVGLDGTPRIFRGLGNAAFEDVSASLGLDQLPSVAAATWTDVDADGHPDLEIEDGGGGLRLLRSREGRGLLPPVVHHRTVTQNSSPSIGATPLGGGYLDANPLSCANTVRDEATGQCVEVSSLPEVGKLVPMSQFLYVQPGTGRVGIGTITPQASLDVWSDIIANGNLILPDDNDSIEFANPSGPSTDSMIFMSEGNSFSALNRMVLTESKLEPETGLTYIRSTNDFVFQEDDETPVLSIDLNSERVRIGDIGSTPHQLTIRKAGDASMKLEADSDNSGEGDQPSLWFSQDGGIVEGRLGMFDSANDVVLENLYQSSDMFFRIVDNETTGQQREFEWHNIKNGSTVDVEMRLTANGFLQIDGTLSSPAADVAEYYPVAEPLEPGDVVAFAGEGLALGLAGPHNAARLAGVVSSKPGVALGMTYTDESDPGIEPEFASDAARFEGVGEYAVDLGVRHEIEVNGRAPLALTGRVPVKVSAENGPIEAGDMLTVSSIPGRAARAVEAGPVIGTALGSLANGQGTILVLVNSGWYSPDPSHELDALARRVAKLERRMESSTAPSAR